MKYRAHGGSFLSRELGNIYDVTVRLHGERADSERTQTVLDYPAGFSGDGASWQRNPAAAEIAGDASLHR
jgi:hypothetical protein